MARMGNRTHGRERRRASSLQCGGAAARGRRLALTSAIVIGGVAPAALADAGDSPIERPEARIGAGVGVGGGAGVGAGIEAGIEAGPEAQPPVVHRTTVGDVRIEVRVQGDVIAPPQFDELFRFAAPRQVRGTMLPPMSHLLSLALAPELEALVDRLDADGWHEREEAAQSLRAIGLPDEQLLAVLAQRGTRGELSAEQWHRLLDIVCDRLRYAPRGALGIRMDRRFDGIPGVLVTDLLPGMPAERSLRAGDRIIEIDGRPVIDTDDLIELVQLRRPGERVALRIARPRRDGDGREVLGRLGQPVFEEVQLAMELGDADQLDRHQDGAPVVNPFGPRRGVVVGPAQGGVSRIRAEQADEARARFAMPAAPIRIGGPRPSSELGVLPDPDDHDSMATMRLYRQLLDDGAIAATPSMRRAWQATLRMLEDRAADPTLPEPIREHYREIARRYAELIPGP